MTQEPAGLRMSKMITSLWIPQAIHAAAELDLAGPLARGALTAGALAARLKTDPDATERLCRALAFLDVLEAHGETFALTELGRSLIGDTAGSRRAWARLMCGTEVWSQWGRLTECVRTGSPAFTDRPFEAMERDPDAAAIFHQAMVEMTSDVAPAMCDALELGAVQRIVDMGGGWGALLCAALDRAPGARGSVFDLGNARPGALALFDRRGLAARAEFVAGDIFTTAPPRADVYLLKSVIHDWDDERSRAILRSCRDAMTPAARLCVIEPPAKAVHEPDVRGYFSAFSDLNMLVVAGGRERTEAQYRALIESAGLRMRALREARGFFQIFEAVRD